LIVAKSYPCGCTLTPITTEENLKVLHVTVCSFECPVAKEILASAAQLAIPVVRPFRFNAN